MSEGRSCARSPGGMTSSMAVNVPRGSRKDVRDAVKAARKAQAGWAKKTAYNRGQILYRAAEALESRAGEFGGDVGEAVDVLVHYAGWTDKLHAVLGHDQPGRRSVLVHVDAGAVGRRRGAVRRRGLRWRRWSRPSPRRWPPATPSSSPCRSARRCPASTSARSSASPTCPAAWSTCCRAARPSSSRPWPPTATSTRSSTPPATRRWPSTSTASPPRPSSASSAASSLRSSASRR